MNLRQLDLNLLVIFDALMTERNVTRAAERVGLSQPAVSNALSRLRAYFGDELLVRGTGDMRPTPRALELADGVRDTLNALGETLNPPAFDPASARRSFAIETIDFVAAVYVPRLMEILRSEAPGVDVRIFPQGGRTFDRLDAQEIQFAIGTYGEVPDRFGKEVLDTLDFVLMMRRDHPLANGAPIDLERYAAAEHLMVSPRGDPHSFIDDVLAKQGLARRVVLTVNHFITVGLIVARSDLVVTVPRQVADVYAEPLGLFVAPAPVSLPAGFSEGHLVWHKRLGRHPANEWFRTVLRRAVADSVKGYRAPTHNDGVA